ncbi:Abi-alpha family protein [Novosphingobium pituita]|uniref:DUF2806 domain-containing protein n=1 Tax=Novosphingobium pituita TaxID=3056842 RepID=A0ABQ6P5Y2_9SPHN|nr:hypothetical protein [Novosphingobium sp. IK01]GMM59974.1 hypothetical protein NUTIK01_07510 [Novosphingobium sp. IK01]
MNENSGSKDLFGIKPISDSILVITKSVMDGAGQFLGRIALPAAEEFGLLLKDKVSEWRKNNCASMLNKAQKKVQQRPDADTLRLHPRLAHIAIDQGSWSDDDALHNAWAGLLASGCNKDASEGVTAIYMNYLSQLSPPQVKIINYVCENLIPFCGESGLVLGLPNIMGVDECIEIAGLSSKHDLDIHIDHMRNSGLLVQGSSVHIRKPVVAIVPSGICINFFIRCQGFTEEAKLYYKDSIINFDNPIVLNAWSRFQAEWS